MKEMLKYRITGEILGLGFIAILYFSLFNSRNSSLGTVIKMMIMLYLPERICIYLQCKTLISEQFKKIEYKKMDKLLMDTFGKEVKK